MIQTTIRNDGRGSMCVPDEEGSAAGSAARTDRIRGRCGAGLKPHPTSSSKKYNEPPGRAIIGPKGGFCCEGMIMECETCVYYVYDEAYDDYVCTMDMDEDDYARLMQDPQAHCPFWRDGDEYATVRKQI